MTRQQAGRAGGLATFSRYGPSHMAALGRRSRGGGRPRWEDTLQREHQRTLRLRGRGSKKGGMPVLPLAPRPLLLSPILSHTHIRAE